MKYPPSLSWCGVWGVGSDKITAVLKRRETWKINILLSFCSDDPIRGHMPGFHPEKQLMNCNKTIYRLKYVIKLRRNNRACSFFGLVKSNCRIMLTCAKRVVVIFSYITTPQDNFGSLSSESSPELFWAVTGHLFGLGGGEKRGRSRRRRRDIMGFTLFRRGGHCSTVRNPAWELPSNDIAPPLFVQGVSAEFDRPLGG